MIAPYATFQNILAAMFGALIFSSMFISAAGSVPLA